MDQRQPIRRTTDIAPRRSMDMRPAPRKMPVAHANPAPAAIQQQPEIKSGIFARKPKPAPIQIPQPQFQKRQDRSPSIPTAPITRPQPIVQRNRPNVAQRPVLQPAQVTAERPPSPQNIPEQAVQPLQYPVESGARGGSLVKTAIQFFVGVGIIVLVATSIVILYVKYYSA